MALAGCKQSKLLRERAQHVGSLCGACQSGISPLLACRRCQGERSNAGSARWSSRPVVGVGARWRQRRLLALPASAALTSFNARW